VVKLGKRHEKGNPMEAPLIIRFKPDKQDYVRASRTLASKSPTFVILAAVIGLMMIGAVVVLVVPSVGDASWANIALVALFVGVFYVLYYFLIIPWQLARTFKGNDYLQTERIFRFSDAHITMNVGNRSSDLPWENFEKVIEGPELYLLIYRSDERVYPFIPKRAFEDEAAELAFRQNFVAKSIPVQ
jgi:hypothetical protein